MMKILFYVFLFLAAIILWALSFAAFRRKKNVLGGLLVLAGMVFLIPLAVMIFTATWMMLALNDLLNAIKAR